MSTTDPQHEQKQQQESKMIFVLDIDSATYKYNCPLTTCGYQSSSIPSILGHMWKFKKKNAVNKTCTGQNSPCITLYPKLFIDSKFKEYTKPTFENEYPTYKWQIIQQYINPSDDDSPPNIISLIQEFNIFVTTDFLQNYPQIKIPSELEKFILDPDFEPDDLPSILTSINNKQPNPSTLDGPAYKKRKLSACESVDIIPQATLSLPSLNMSPKSSSHSNSMINHMSNNTSLSFDLNQYKNENNNNNNTNNNNKKELSVIIPSSMNNNNRRKRRRKCVGMLCNACNTEINPCHTMIKCIECIGCDIEMNDGDIILCIACFKNGREFMKHKRFHRYNVLRPLTHFKLQNCNIEPEVNQNKCGRKSKLTHNKWNANDEWNLLAGIRRYGLGNWSGITKIINKNNINTENIKHFDYKHVEAHFHLKYKHKLYQQNENVVQEQKYNNNNNNVGKAASVAVTKRGGKKGRKHGNSLSQNSVPKYKESKFTDKHKAKCGYRELRDEFEAEWNNDAEAMIGEMYFSEYDTKSERALKMEGLRLYNNVLKERKIRKQFVKKYGVFYAKRTRNKRNLTEHELKLEEEISNNLSKFARFTKDKNNNFSEFKLLTHGLIEEKRLRENIYKLRHYLLNGITSIDKMNKIETFVERQQQLMKQRKDKIQMKRDELIRHKSHNRHNKNNKNKNFNHEIDFEDEIMDSIDSIDSDSDDIINLKKFKNSDQYLNTLHSDPFSLDAISTYLTLIEQENNKKNKNKYEMKEGGDSGGLEVNDEHVNGWNLKKMDGFNRLCEGEKMLCNVLKIGPNDYKWIEQQIAKRVYLHGLLNKNKIPQQLYIDIGDVKNVQNTMTMKIGLVDPQVLDDNISIPKSK